MNLRFLLLVNGDSIPEKGGDRKNINCTSLVRFVYQTCGWNCKHSYRILGVPRLEQQLIKFDLKLAQKTNKEYLRFPKASTGRIVYGKFPVR